MGSEQADQSLEKGLAVFLGLCLELPSFTPGELGSEGRTPRSPLPDNGSSSLKANPVHSRHLHPAECTREEDWASEAHAYEKYNKENWMQQTGSDEAEASAGRRGLGAHSSLSPHRPE